jgi:IMP cyclohydrolase
MYVGRLLVARPGLVAYRVSSRSFPDRRAVAVDDEVRVVPEGESPENPYVSYACLRRVGDRLAVGNGDHVAPLARKLGDGHPPRDALATTLTTMDYERDDYDTPRIAGVVGAETAWLGVVARDGVAVERVGEPSLVATYERDRPRPVSFGAEDAGEAAREAYDLEFEHPVCAVGATVAAGEPTVVETAVANE